MDDETKLTLHGLQQYYCKLKDSEKNRKLFDLLDVLEFNQVRMRPSPNNPSAYTGCLIHMFQTRTSCILWRSLFILLVNEDKDVTCGPLYSRLVSKEFEP